MIHLNVVKQFQFEGAYVNGFSYGSGHINSTFVAVFKVAPFHYRRYLMQKINHHVFHHIAGLMQNIRKVTDFVHESIKEQGGDPYAESLTLIKTVDDKDYYYSETDGYWRAYLFIEEGIGFDVIENINQFYESGLSFGKFQKLLAQFNADELHDTIPNFHHTPTRFKALQQAIEENKSGRKNLVLDEISFYLDREHYINQVTQQLEIGKMPYRVTHNDTKLNNVLISPITQKGVCVIDLDTIMKGSIVYDFGDSIRFGANRSQEDEKDLSKVNFDMELFEAYTKGFIGEVKDVLTPSEINYMAFGAILMTYECGMRFLTDFLNGDTYFKTKYDTHNLDRTRTQMKLVIDMEQQIDVMHQIIKKYT